MALVMDRLRELNDDITDTRHTLDDLTAQRDDLLCQMRQAGIPFRALQRLTGLSKSRIVQIVDKAKSNAALRVAELVAASH